MPISSICPVASVAAERTFSAGDYRGFTLKQGFDNWASTLPTPTVLALSRKVSRSLSMFTGRKRLLDVLHAQAVCGAAAMAFTARNTTLASPLAYANSRHPHENRWASGRPTRFGGSMERLLCCNVETNQELPAFWGRNRDGQQAKFTRRPQPQLASRTIQPYRKSARNFKLMDGLLRAKDESSDY